jgi:DNA-directed RNA polymerase specialized sigma24 family protein
MAEQNLNSEQTENLMEYIQWKDDPEYAEIAKQAFRVFTYRFQLDLQKKLIPICKNWGYDEQVANEIAYSTFERIWKYSKFDINKAKQKEDYDKAIIFYLYGIASHLLADYKRSQNEEGNPFIGDEQIIREFPDVDKMNLGKEKKAILKENFDFIQKALDRLTPKHKIIYLTYKQYESETKDGYKLPRKLLKSLREELDLTQTSVRVYKHEAFNEVETYLKIYGAK